MSKRIILTSVITVILASRFADGKPLPNACSAASLEAAYGYILTGSAVGSGPVAAVGLVAFDGAGGLTAHETLSTNGVITRRSGEGSYTANENCTGSASLEDDFAGFAFNFVIVPGTDAAELGLIVTNQGSLITGVAKRVEQERCDETILQGSYQSAGGGTVLAAGPNVGVGFRIFDGEGNASGEDTFSDNGEISHRVVSLTYTVESDCSGSFRRGDGALFDLVVVGGGTEILNVRADPGTIITARYKKGS